MFASLCKKGGGEREEEEVAFLDVEILHVERVVFNELST